MLKFEILLHGERSEVAFNEFRSWAGTRFINGKEYHSPFIYNHLTLERAPREQARACACAICRGDYDAMTEGEGETVKRLLTMEEVRVRLYLKGKRANRLLLDIPRKSDEDMETQGKLVAYNEILEDTFRIEKAIE